MPDLENQTAMSGDKDWATAIGKGALVWFLVSGILGVVHVMFFPRSPMEDEPESIWHYVAGICMWIVAIGAGVLTARSVLRASDSTNSHGSGL